MSMLKYILNIFYMYTKIYSINPKEGKKGRKVELKTDVTNTKQMAK